MSSWKDAERSFTSGPSVALKEGTRWIWKVGLVAIVLVVGLSIVGSALGWFSEAATVARQEFGPRAMLEKYEWFKDASAQLDKKRADIDVYAAQIAEVKIEGGADRFSRADLNQWRRELAGIKSSYNTLAAEYNSQMAKFNWAFANAGQLPEGAIAPLPREYKPYTME